MTLNGTASSTSQTGIVDPNHAALPVNQFDSAANITPPSAKPLVVTFSNLAKKLETYLSPADMKRILEAFRFADEKHLGQIRKSGEPYISHPLAVAEICAGWKLDAQAVMAALLHDVVEDQGVTLDELIERFGAPVAAMVDGLSKLEKLQFKTHVDAQGENFRKMLLAMARDVRVILIKLADRLHNMRTLDVMNRSKQFRIASETMEVYVPIAHRLGINNLYREMQDLAFHRLYPYRYEVLSKAIQASRGNRRVLLGSREMMKRHDIEVPSLDYEKKYTKNGQRSPIYLAVAGKLFGMFLVSYRPDRRAAETLDSLAQSGISVLVQADDFNITAPLVAATYGIPEGTVKVLSQHEQDALETELAYRPESEGVMMHTGACASFLGGMRAAARAAAGERLAGVVQTAAVALGAVLSVALGFYEGLTGLSLGTVLAYQLVWCAIIASVPFAKKP